jgi:hypothetical protein
MNIGSIIIFFIYVIAILMILVYISPILASFVMILVPVLSIYILPEPAIGFIKEQQFSFAGTTIQNLHILLLIWSAVIGLVASTEIISWYLESEKPRQKPNEPEKSEAPLNPISQNQ